MEVFLDTCGRRRVKFLLLLYLFVVKAAAACSKPKGMENTVLTDKSLLMNEFPEGSEVHWECAHGYVRDGGSGSMTCVDDNWTEPDLICKKNDCGPPKPQPNMNFNMSAGTLFGASIKVTCDKGFRVVGSSYKQCYATGWSGRAKCESWFCGFGAKCCAWGTSCINDTRYLERLEKDLCFFPVPKPKSNPEKCRVS